jgi:ubiquinone/menaquinone biosynthesis C-methylase UbiE
MRTAKRGRQYYNKLVDYESLVRQEGFLCPGLLVKNLKPYLNNGQTILDVGCGPGLIGDEVAKVGWSGTLIGIDIAEKRLQEAASKSVYTFCVHADAYHLPFGRRFDLVISNAMVGLTGPKSVQEMRRVIKPSGHLACIAGEIKTCNWSVKNFENPLCNISGCTGRSVAKVLNHNSVLTTGA